MAGGDFGLSLVSDRLDPVIEGAELVLLAMPTGAMPDTVLRIGRFSPGTIVTDVGSVKRPVMADTAPLVAERRGRFVGSHPMAGSEKAGFEAADADLLEGAAVLLTPDSGTDGEALGQVETFWRFLGARTETMDAATHDGIVAAVSHLPHLAAASLVHAVLGEDSSIGAFAGGGLRDTTRIASGPPEMWSGILADNRDAVLAMLDRYLEELSRWREALDSVDRETLRTFLSEARSLRETL